MVHILSVVLVVTILSLSVGEGDAGGAFKLVKRKSNCNGDGTSTNTGQKSLAECAVVCRKMSASYFAFARTACTGDKCLCWCQARNGAKCNVGDHGTDDLYKLPAYSLVKGKSNCRNDGTSRNIGKKSLVGCARLCKAMSASYFAFARDVCTAKRCLCWCQARNGAKCNIGEHGTDDLYELH